MYNITFKKTFKKKKTKHEMIFAFRVERVKMVWIWKVNNTICHKAMFGIWKGAGGFWKAKKKEIDKDETMSFWAREYGRVSTDHIKRDCTR